MEAPCTFFLVGQTAEHSEEDLKRFVGASLFDLQSHTYSHLLLKTVCMQKGDQTTVYRGGTLAEIERNVRRGLAVLEERLGVRAEGLCGPFGYYRGLSDRPDILGILGGLGIRFTRTYARDCRDYQPVGWEAQPFWYEAQGHPEILEIPVQGWQDVYLREALGWEAVEAFADHLCSDLEEALAGNKVWSFATHDWSAIRNDLELTAMRRLITVAQERGVRLLTHCAFYRERMETRVQAEDKRV